jgi:outer membrane protein assembly complex protein YaeT
MRSATALCLLLAAAGCSSAPDPSDPEGQEHLEFRGVEKSHEPELRELVAPDLRRYLEDPRDTVLDDAVFRLRYHYRFEGRADVQVEFERTPTKVIFKVQEGPRVTLGRVHFYDNTVFTSDELKAARPRGFLGEAVPFSDRLVTMLRDEVLAEYGKKGYIEAEVEVEQRRAPEDPGRVHLSFVLKEGRQFTLSGIDGILDEVALSEKLARFVLEPYTPSVSEEVEATIIDHYRDRGRPFAQAIAMPKIDRQAGRVWIELDVRPGREAKIGALRITGNLQARDSFVRQRADLEAGEPYRASDLRRAEKRLLDTQLFKSARVSPGTLQEATGELAIDVALEEKEAGEFALRGGWGSHEGPRGGADLSYMNLLGGAEMVRVGGTISPLGFRSDAELAFPYFLGTEFRPGVAAWIEDHQFPSFDTRSYGTLGSLGYRISDELGVSTGVRYSIIRTDNVDPAVPPGDLLDFAYTALFLSGTATFVDNPRLPTEGIVASAEVDWSPQSLRSDVVFVSASGRVSGYVPLPWDLVLASSFQGGIIVPRGSTEEIPISLRYFAGGETTVRGFRRDRVGSQVGGQPTGGEVYMAVQTELRFPIWGDVHGAVFTDQGGVWFDHNHVAIDESRWSVGIGLRYYTAAGAFVIDLGWNPHPNREIGEKSFDPQFSIGFPF